MTEPDDRPLEPIITLPGRDGPAAIIRRDPGGIYGAEILDEAAREEAEAIAAHLNRPRAPRGRASC